MLQLRKEYTQEDEELIKEAKTSSSQRSEPPTHAQKTVAKGESAIFGKLTSLPLSLSLSHTHTHTHSLTYTAMIELCTHIVIRTDALLPPRTLPKDLNNDQLVYLFNNHPILMATEYHRDIGRFKGIDSCFCDHVDLLS